MKLTTEQNVVTRSGNFTEKGFTIKASAKAFDILSRQVYTNVPLAIVRELSTNAWDAQVDAGNTDQPFIVHLPSNFEPFFSIRDFGTGLSPEQLETIYTTYFESTRNTSDEFTGCLGLGSKSPFAYTDQFTVTSYYNGTCYIYSAFKSESGQPSIALLGEADTNEPNGLDIKINIESKDYGDFYNSASAVYRFFKLRPKIIGASINLPDDTPLIDDGKYRVYHKSQYPNGLGVVMGQVYYRINHHNVKNPFQYLSGTSVIINADIGAVGVSASREDLHYDEKTVKYLNNGVEKILEGVKLFVEEKMKDATTMLEKLIIQSTFQQIVPTDTNLYLAFPDDVATVMSANIAYRTNRMTTYRQQTFKPHANQKYIFIDDDIDTSNKMLRRIKHYLMGIDKNDTQVFICKIKDMAAFTALVGDPTVQTSKLPDAPMAPRSPRGTIKPQYVKVIDCTDTYFSVAPVGTIDTADACVVPKNREKAIVGGGSYNMGDIAKIAKFLGYKRIYFITETHYKKRSSNLEEFETVAEDYINQWVKCASETQLSRLDNQYDIPNWLAKIKTASKTCLDWSAVYTCMGSDEVDNIRALARLFRVEIPDGPNYQENFYKRYPLLKLLNHYLDNNQNNLNSIKDYITLIEENS